MLQKSILNPFFSRVRVLTRYDSSEIFARIVGIGLSPIIRDGLGFYGIFYFFAGVVAVIGGYALVIMPENKGEALTKTESKMQS